MDLIEKAAQYIHSVALGKLKAAEGSAIKLASDLSDNLNTLVLRAKTTLRYVQDMKSRASGIEEELMSNLFNKYEKLKKAALKLEIPVGNFRF